MTKMTNFKIGLNEYPWESMRSPEEIREEENHERHLEGSCEGAPYCWECQEQREEAEAANEQKTDAVIESITSMFEAIFRARERS